MKWIDNLAVRWLLRRRIPVVMNCTIENGVQLVGTDGAIVIRNSMVA